MKNITLLFSVLLLLTSCMNQENLKNESVNSSIIEISNDNLINMNIDKQNDSLILYD